MEETITARTKICNIQCMIWNNVKLLFLRMEILSVQSIASVAKMDYHSGINIGIFF